MTYRILSPRIGTPGDTYTPDDGVNVDALIAGGFIAEDDKHRKPSKPDQSEE